MILVLQNGDIMKVDIGVHVKGRIVDSAFTLSWNPDYEKLLEAVKAATDTGIRVCNCACIGVRMARADGRTVGGWDRREAGRTRRVHSGDDGVL